MTPDCEAPEGANAFIEFALQPQYLAMWSNTIGLFPASQAALDQTENYQEGGPLEVFFDLSEAQSLIRPPTPGYATMALIFREALLDIANGADVQTTLDAAVDEIRLSRPQRLRLLRVAVVPWPVVARATTGGTASARTEGRER